MALFVVLMLVGAIVWGWRTDVTGERGCLAVILVPVAILVFVFGVL